MTASIGARGYNMDILTVHLFLMSGIVRDVDEPHSTVLQMPIYNEMI